MPLDGIVADSIVQELQLMLTGGRVDKVFQPEQDEIIIQIRSKGINNRLLLSANPNFPRIHLTGVYKENPSNPPVFCMLLRKHLIGGKVLSFDFHDYERIISINIESINELGDLSTKKLIIEIMGRHSNIILVHESGKIIDAIKHVSLDMSRVREVMPAREYVLPPVQDKINPLVVDVNRLFSNEQLECTLNSDTNSPISAEKYLLNNIKGFSPFLCKEICNFAGIDGKKAILNILNNNVEVSSLKDAINKAILKIRLREYSPFLLFSSEKHDKPLDFHCISLLSRPNAIFFNSINDVLDNFFSKKSFSEKLTNKQSSLIKVLDTHIDRCNKKLAIQQDSLRESSDREKLKLYGELITAFIYSIPNNAESVTLPNYYSENNELIEIPLNKNKTPQENLQLYFKRYAKAKSTFQHASKQIEETLGELDYLESVYHLLKSCGTLGEVDEIAEELAEQGYLKSRISKRKKSNLKTPSSPLHYVSSEGFDIYVGKNNKQNDQLTFKIASSKDIWMHTRNIPGSHVIIRSFNKEITETTLEEAAMLAAYHSKASKSAKVPVDYTTVKFVKKPPGAKPGMVIYDNFKTYIVTPNEEIVDKLKKVHTK